MRLPHRRRLGAALAALVALGPAGLATLGSAGLTTLDPTGLAAPQAAITAAAPGPDITETVAAMSVDQLIGQMTWVHVYGATAQDTSMAAENRARYGVDTPAAVVAKYDLGGVLYFSWAGNTQGPDQIAELSAGLQQAAAAGPGVPLAVTVDQEGGEVSRIGPPATALPGGMALGATFDPELARAQGEVLGTELAAMGVNVDFAPVADLNTNPANPVIGLRSLGADPHTVSTLTAAQVEGLQANGVAAAAKHFPGHGDTDVDSHTGLPVVTGEQAELDAHLEPFRGALDAGVDIIMSAHIVVESLDPDLPGTLSPRVLTGLLRDELGFTGLVTTDALDMQALKQLPGNPLDDGDIAVLAIQAGSDILLGSPDVDASFAAIRAAVDSGDLTRERLKESVTRILQWKVERGIWDETTPPGLDVVGSQDHLATAEEISARAVTLLRNEDDLSLPLDATDALLVVGAGSAWPERLVPLLEAEGFAVTEQLESGASPSAGYRSAAASAAAQADAVVVTVDELRANPAQQALVEELAAGPAPVVVVLAGAPYDLATVPSDVAAVLATYGAATVNLQGVAAVLSGRLAPTGRLPVEVTAPDGTVVAELGHGLRTTTEVTPREVTFTDLPGTDVDVVSVPDTEGVVYLLDGEPIGPGEHPGLGTVVVTAQADDGFHLAADSPGRWEHSFDATSPSSPAEPAASSGPGGALVWLVAGAAAAVLIGVVAALLRHRRG